MKDLTQSQATNILKKAGMDYNKGNLIVTGDFKDYVRQGKGSNETMKALRLKAIKELEKSDKQIEKLERKALKSASPYERRELQRIIQSYNESANKLYKTLSSKSSNRARPDLKLVNRLESIINYNEMSKHVTKAYLSESITTTITAIIGNLPFDLHITSADLTCMQELAGKMGIPLAQDLQKRYDEYMAVSVGSDQFVEIISDAANALKEKLDGVDTDNPNAKELMALFDKYGF